MIFPPTEMFFRQLDRATAFVEDQVLPNTQVFWHDRVRAATHDEVFADLQTFGQLRIR